MKFRPHELLSDDEVADLLLFYVKHLQGASELLFDTSGKIRNIVFIESSFFILNEVTNQLTDLIAHLRINGNVYKTREAYRNLCNAEEAYKDDQSYFEGLCGQGLANE